MSTLLSDNERLVYNVVKEYLDYNRVFNIEKLVSFVKTRFRGASININNEGIESLLRSLVFKRILVEGSKLTQDRVLNNENRNLIHEYICQYPGIHLKKIINELNLSVNVVVWHVTILENFNYINNARIENRIIFYSSDLKFNQVMLYYFTSNEHGKKILDYFKYNNHGITKNELSTALNMHHNTVVKFLDSLEECEIVEIQKIRPNMTLYFLKDNLLSVI